MIHLLNRIGSKSWTGRHAVARSRPASQLKTHSVAGMAAALMRCLIPILFAMGLARPVLTSWQSAGGGGNRSIVLLIE